MSETESLYRLSVASMVYIIRREKKQKKKNKIRNLKEKRKIIFRKCGICERRPPQTANIFFILFYFIFFFLGGGCILPVWGANAFFFFNSRRMKVFRLFKINKAICVLSHKPRLIPPPPHIIRKYIINIYDHWLVSLYPYFNRWIQF